MKIGKNLMGLAFGAAVLIVFALSAQGRRSSAQSTFASSSSAAISHTPGVVSKAKARLVSHLDPTLKMRVRFVLTPPNQDELARFLKDVQDPRSPSFHRFLTLAEWKARYAPSDADVDAVINWAESNGLTLTYRFDTNLAVVMDADVRTVEKVLGLTMNRYEFDGKKFYSNDRDPTVPLGAAHVVQDVLGLNSIEKFHSPHSPDEVKQEPEVKPGPFRAGLPAPRAGEESTGGGSEASLQPAITGGNPQATNLIEPQDLWNTEGYNYGALQKLSKCCNPMHSSSGSPKEMSIAVVGGNAPLPSDYLTFFKQYGLSPIVNPVEVGSPSCCDDEMTLDVEWAAAMSSNPASPADAATIFIYEAQSAQIDDLFDAWQMAMMDNRARVFTTSFGGPESFYGQISDRTLLDFDNTAFAMASIGWSMVAAAGDRGAYDDCQTLSVDYPASDPEFIGVGGTTLTFGLIGGKLVFAKEMAWGGNGCGNSLNLAANLGGGGGGCSIRFFAPWQPQICSRSVPDVALNAGCPNGSPCGSSQAFFYSFGKTPGWQGVGGTSIGAPEMAGFFAQANAYLASLGSICGAQHNAPCGPLGNPGPALYAAPSSAPHNPFYDITQGCNGGDTVSFSLGQGFIGTPQQGFCAVPGYDQATGLGSANMLQLAWAINSFFAPVTKPVITFGPVPAANQWYNTDRHVVFAVGGAAEGIAGFTAQWDQDPGDPTTHATPGSGDPFWDGPQVPNGSAGALRLAAAGEGCHFAFVRAWSNTGKGSDPSGYGQVCYDITPPSITCGSPDNLWHATDVVISCTATDALSGLANLSDVSFNLTTSVLVGTETSNTFTSTHAVCDVAGNCATAGPIGPIKVDKKPPTITITQPAATTYLHNSILTLNYSVTDGGSGVAGFTPTMDGSTTLAGQGLASGQVINLLTELSTGAHTFSVSAIDNVGNQGASSVTFTIIVTPGGLIAEVNQFLSNGAISNSAIAGAWLAMLNQALAARNGGNCVAAAGIYTGFVNSVMAQSGKAITPTAASILVADAQYLINHCP